ncbi:TLC domain-containing protein 4-B-like [Branchiostoma floridae x Branchiostoma japonicum]
MMELTNPFVNFRFMLKALGYPEKSLLFSCTGVLIFITWWIARLGPIPIYAYHMAQLMSTGDFFKIELSMQLTSVLGYAFFTVLNLAWFRVIIKLFKREIRGLIQQGHSMAKRVQQETNSKKGG